MLCFQQIPSLIPQDVLNYVWIFFIYFFCISVMSLINYRRQTTVRVIFSRRETQHGSNSITWYSLSAARGQFNKGHKGLYFLSWRQFTDLPLKPQQDRWRQTQRLSRKDRVGDDIVSMCGRLKVKRNLAWDVWRFDMDLMIMTHRMWPVLYFLTSSVASAQPGSDFRLNYFTLHTDTFTLHLFWSL